MAIDLQLETLEQLTREHHAYKLIADTDDKRISKFMKRLSRRRSHEAQLLVSSLMSTHDSRDIADAVARGASPEQSD